MSTNPSQPGETLGTTIAPDSPLALSLQRQRDRFNARFAYARRLSHEPESAAFAHHLAAVVEPIVRAVADEQANSVDVVTEVLFDSSLALMAKRMLGAQSRYPAMNRLWRQLLPRIPRLLATQPQQIVSSLANAVYNLSIEGGAQAEVGPTTSVGSNWNVSAESERMTATLPSEKADVEVIGEAAPAPEVGAKSKDDRTSTPDAFRRPKVVLWLDRMEALAPMSEGPRQFLEAGKVAAWRCGMAHYRDSALEVLSELPSPLGRASLGLLPEDSSQSAKDLVASLSDPWWFPGLETRTTRREPAIVARIGGFRGFGGQFLTPPEVIAIDEQLYAFDDESCWSLHADCFGSTLVRFGDTLPDGEPTANTGVSIQKSGKVSWSGASVTIPVLRKFCSAASTPHTLAVTILRSHQVFLLASVRSQL